MMTAHKQTNKHTVYSGRLLPGEEIRVLAPDFPVEVGGQGGQEGGQEGGLGDALGLLGSVAVLDNRPGNQDNLLRKGVLEGPATHLMRLGLLVDLRTKSSFKCNNNQWHSMLNTHAWG